MFISRIETNMKIYNYVLFVAVLIFMCIACNKNIRHGNKINPSTKFVYSVKDSVYFDLVNSGSPAHEGLKEFNITIDKSDSTIYVATYSCSIDYYLDCACQISDDPKPKPFSIKYKVDYNFKVANNDNVEILELNEAQDNLRNLYSDKSLEKKCDKLVKKAIQYLEDENSLKTKFRYLLSHIHRYENTNLPQEALSKNNSMYATIDYGNIESFTDISEVIEISNAGKKEIDIWKIETKPEFKELQILSVSDINEENKKSIEEIGNSFLKNELEFESISNFLFDYKTYKLDSKTSCLEEFQLRLRTENGQIIHHMYQTISLMN